MATVLESVKIVLGLEAKGFAAVSGQVKSFQQGVLSNVAQLKTAVAGYISIAAGKELVRAVSEMAERWKDISEQTGLSTDAVQKYDAAFKKVGLSAEDAAAAFDLLTEKRRQALEEGGAAAQLFRAFGISEQELRSLDSGASLFERMAKGRSASNQGDRELFGQMFGSRGGRAGKLLAGATSVAEGGDISLMSADDIKALDDASKRFEAASRDFKTAAAPLVTSLLSLGTQAMGGLRGLITGEPVTKQNGAKGGLVGALEDALESSGDVAVKEREFEYRKRTGKKLRNLPALPTSYDEAVGFSQEKAGLYSKEQEAVRNKLNEAVFSTLFKAGNTGQQKTLLNQQMKDLLGQAGAEKDPVKAAELKGKAFSLAGNLAELSRTESGMFAPDSLAAVGGIVGGAGIAADPGLNVATSQLEELRNIVNGVQELKDALEHSPMKDLR